LVALIFTSCHSNSSDCCDGPESEYHYTSYKKYDYNPYFEIEPAQECSRVTGKPILIMFTGFGCLSITGIDWEILAEKDVKKIVDDNYILPVLYVDDKTKIEEIDSTKKTHNGEIITTIGQRNATLQVNKFGTIGQPYYFFVDSNLTKIVEPLGYSLLKEKDIFISRLKEGMINPPRP